MPFVDGTSYFIDQSEAAQIVEAPGEHAKDHFEYGEFTLSHVDGSSLRETKDSSSHIGTFSVGGEVSIQGVEYPAQLNISFPGMVKRGIARVLNKEPRPIISRIAGF